MEWYFQIPRDHRFIRNEILNGVMTYLKKFFSVQDNLPSKRWKCPWSRLSQYIILGLKAMREISYTLSYTYPAMFQYRGGKYEDWIKGEDYD